MLRVGIIGCGFMGTMHSNCYKNIEGVEIVALADLRKEKAEELAAGTNAAIYGDGKELIDNAELDIIDICLPTYLHAKYAIMAMEKVKYLFVEKPVAFTMEDAEAMRQKQKETGCNIQVGQVIRFWDEYVKLKEMIDSGKYGKITVANFHRLSPIPTWGWKNWLLDVNFSGGAAQDLHIHDVDFTLSVFGKPRDFYAIKNSRGLENSYINAILKYDDFLVNIEGTWGLPESYPFNAGFRVVTDKGVIELAGGKLMLYTDDGETEIKIEKKKLGDGFKGGNISDLGGYYNELVYFTSKAKCGGKIENATLAQAIDSLDFVLEEIKRA